MVINYPEDLADAANGVTDFVVFNDGTHDTWEQTEGEGAGLRKIKEIVVKVTKEHFLKYQVINL